MSRPTGVMCHVTNTLSANLNRRIMCVCFYHLTDLRSHLREDCLRSQVSNAACSETATYRLLVIVVNMSTQEMKDTGYWTVLHGIIST